ncbi:MAG: adenylate/guanylate cyclase domain-containing protein [Burkholderiales bacterium]|nr:adenylate/guanylate cyclase domain-containing protein [Burkholderiales bacterium]
MHSLTVASWSARLGLLCAILIVAATAEALFFVLTAPDALQRTDGLLTMVISALGRERGFSPLSLLRALFVLTALVNVVTACVGAWVLLRAGSQAAARQAGWLLIVCGAQGFWAFFVGGLPRYAGALPWLFAAYGTLYVVVLMGMAGYFFVAVARFLVLFPRPVKTWTIIEALPMGSRIRGFSRIKAVLPSVQRWHTALLSGRALWGGVIIGALMIPVTSVVSRGSPSGLGGGIAFVLVAALFILFALGLWFAYASMTHVHRFGTPDERRRTVWLRGMILAIVLPMAAGLILLIARRVLLPDAGPLPTEFALAVFACFALLPQIIALAISSAVIQRGVLDPRAGFTRFTLWTVLGLVLTLMFVLVERFVALKVVAWLQLPADSGAVLAGALIATTFLPLRTLVSRQVNRLAERWLPLTLVAEGEQVVRTVVITDLSGYTALAAQDSDQARLQSAALKRAAQLALDAHGGRLVKSMGDAVMLVFERPAQALAVVRRVHAEFPGMAAALGYDPLPLHSAVHEGEIVEARDGDIFGHTVNVTARLVDAAKAGEIVLSGPAVAAVTVGSGEPAEFSDIGERRFRNVPEPVHCFRLVAAPSAQPEAT